MHRTVKTTETFDGEGKLIVRTTEVTEVTEVVPDPVVSPLYAVNPVNMSVPVSGYFDGLSVPSGDR